MIYINLQVLHFAADHLHLVRNAAEPYQQKLQLQLRRWVSYMYLSISIFL